MLAICCSILRLLSNVTPKLRTHDEGWIWWPYHLKNGQNPYQIRVIRIMWHVWGTKLLIHTAYTILNPVKFLLRIATNAWWKLKYTFLYCAVFATLIIYWFLSGYIFGIGKPMCNISKEYCYHRYNNFDTYILIHHWMKLFKNPYWK